MTVRYASAFSRHDAPESYNYIRPKKKRAHATLKRGRGATSREGQGHLKRGAGKTGCTLHPRSRVQTVHQRNAHEHTGSAEAVRPSLRNGFTASFVLSLVTGLIGTIAPEKS
jgi:hypothetical protein